MEHGITKFLKRGKAKEVYTKNTREERGANMPVEVIVDTSGLLR